VFVNDVEIYVVTYLSAYIIH